MLERSPQTINDNVKKGTVLQVNKRIQNGKAYFYEKEIYFADINFRVYKENRENCGRRPKWIDGSKFIEWADEMMLQKKWSSDVIVNKARIENLYHESILPSTSTLYHWIDSGIMKTKNTDLLEKVDRKPCR